MSAHEVLGGAPVDERELRRLIKDWRTGRATRRLGQAISDAYVAVFAGVMVTAMVVNVLLKAQTVAADCSQAGCLSARSFLPWATLALCLAGSAMAARLFGPVLASAAEGFWLLDGQVRRNRLLGGRLVAAVAIALGVGAVVGALITLLTGAGASAIVAWGAATGLACAGLVAWSAAEQGRDRTILTRIVLVAFGALTVATLLLVVAVAAGWLSLPVTDATGLAIAGGVGALGLALLIGSFFVARARLNRIRRARLVSGGSLVKGLSGAFFALDLGLAHDIVVERAAMERGHVRVRRGGGSGLAALRWREVQRALRSPGSLVVLATTVVVPYAADALGMSMLAPIFGALTLWLAMIPLMGGLRVLTRTSGLARIFPFSTPQLRLAAITVPVLVGAFWAVASVPAFMGFGSGVVHRGVGDAILVSVVTAAAGVLGAMRWTVAKPVDFGAPMLATQAGAFPPGMMGNLIKGLDMCLLITAPVLLGWSPLISFALAGIVVFVLLGYFNMDDLRAQQERQQRELAAARGGRAAQAKVVTPAAAAPSKPSAQSKSARAEQQEIAKLTQKKKPAPKPTPGKGARPPAGQRPKRPGAK